MYRLQRKLLGKDYEEVYEDPDHILYRNGNGNRNQRIIIRPCKPSLEYEYNKTCNPETGCEKYLRAIFG